MLPKFIPSVTQNELILQSFFSLHVKMFPKLLKDDCTQSHHSLAKRNACALICVYVWHSTYILRSHQAWTTWQHGVIASRDQEQLKIYFTKPGKIDKTILSYFFRRQVRCFCFQERKISLRQRALWKEATQLTLQDWPGGLIRTQAFRSSLSRIGFLHKCSCLSRLTLSLWSVILENEGGVFW